MIIRLRRFKDLLCTYNPTRDRFFIFKTESVWFVSDMKEYCGDVIEAQFYAEFNRYRTDFHGIWIHPDWVEEVVKDDGRDQF